MAAKAKSVHAAPPSSTYFGLPDAAHEDTNNLLQDHVSIDIEPQLKIRDRAQGYQIIVGIKGSGKTALRRYLQLSDSKAISWEIDADHNVLNLDPTTLAGRSGIVKNILALEILREFANNVQDPQQMSRVDQKTAVALKQLSTGILGILQNVRDAVEIKAGFVNVDLSELLKARSSTAVTKALLVAQAGLAKALHGSRAYIMIDDVDDVFPSIEDNPVFVEALVRAVHDINSYFGSTIHVLLFLKYGVWRRWFDNQQELDRVRHIIKDVRWDHAGLCRVIARRVARIHALPPGTDKDIPTLWAHEFDWTEVGDFETFAHRFTDLCASGPRDIVYLANKAKENAGSHRIRIQDLAAQEKQYSENKLGQINADFGSVYPSVGRFIDSVFHSCPEEMTGPDAGAWIEQHALTTKRVDDDYRKHPWYGSKERLTALMYEVGLWGIKTPDGRIVYSLEAATKSPSEIQQASVVIHPAFRPHLGTKSRKIAARSRKAPARRKRRK